MHANGVYDNQSADLDWCRYDVTDVVESIVGVIRIERIGDKLPK